MLRVMTTPIVRDYDEDLATVPRHWMSGNAAATAIANGINMLFPHGERFFVRSVNHFIDHINDPALKKQVKAFFQQEGRHASAHDDFNEVLRHHGFEIDGFLENYRGLFLWVEKRVPPKLNLAGTAAAEHFTATLAEGVFTRDVLETLHPKMRRLLAWHAAEEIEHKAVAFDVLQAVDPSYFLRIAGLAYATSLLGGFWLWATIALARQEQLTPRSFFKELRNVRVLNSVIKTVFGAGIRQYAKRKFHPRDNANEQLAERWFAAHGLAMPDAA